MKRKAPVDEAGGNRRGDGSDSGGYGGHAGLNEASCVVSLEELSNMSDDDPRKWELRRFRRRSKPRMWRASQGSMPDMNMHGDFSGAPRDGIDAAATMASVKQQTNQISRHARRLYIGHLPAGTTEEDLRSYFNGIIKDKMVFESVHGGCNREIASVYINHERHFSFLEFFSVEITSALLMLDGVMLPGRGSLRIRRPNDFDATRIDPNMVLPKLTLDGLDIIENMVKDGPDKIFIGGLPHSLNDEEVKKMIQDFGRLKSFHLVKEAGSSRSKGYAFFEYVDTNNTDEACATLNGRKIVDSETGAERELTVRRASTRADNSGSVHSYSADGVGNNVAVSDLVNTAMGGYNAPSSTTTNSDAAAAAAAALEAAFGGSVPSKTKILVLHNMITYEDLASEEEYADLCLDIKGECEKLANLVSLKVPKKGEPGTLKVFLEYATVADAIQAEKNLNGREFGSSIVKVSFLSENDYFGDNLE